MRSRDALSFGLEDKGECSCSHVTELNYGTEGRMIILCSLFYFILFYFFAANNFPICPQEVGWTKSVASEVREAVTLPTVK
jgi:hypothetical protein